MALAFDEGFQVLVRWVSVSKGCHFMGERKGHLMVVPIFGWGSLPMPNQCRSKRVREEFGLYSNFRAGDVEGVMKGVSYDFKSHHILWVCDSHEIRASAMAP